MSCQCFQIGGPFIAEDPDCPIHDGGLDRRVEQHVRAACNRTALIEAIGYALQAQFSDTTWNGLDELTINHQEPVVIILGDVVDSVCHTLNLKI